MGGEFRPVRSFTASYEVDIRGRQVEWSCSRYDQIDFGSSIAWLLTATVFKEDVEAELQFVLVPLETGLYRLDMRLNQGDEEPLSSA